MELSAPLSSMPRSLDADSFISIVQNKTRVLILAFFIIYQLFFWSWGSLYYLLVRFKPGCIYGADSFVEAWVFAVVTQMTVGAWVHGFRCGVGVLPPRGEGGAVKTACWGTYRAWWLMERGTGATSAQEAHRDVYT